MKEGGTEVLIPEVYLLGPLQKTDQVIARFIALVAGCARAVAQSRSLYVTMMGCRQNSGESRPVQRQQLAPGALGVGLTVNRITVLHRHVRYAPAVLRARIDLDFRRYFRRSECFSQFVFRIRLTHVVVCRDCDVQSRLDPRREQMRAVGLVGHQASAME